ncbi:RNA polymerase sigma factor [Paenibacillus koleovorans]|uniref:RNA polymerase sigma factor n=1 Tax=Paenibacillus koleovorans TaxID=121608 RepID=UPI001FE76F27|nr:RNA polymerase sigma factor [Paenibacillus koleovorans]
MLKASEPMEPPAADARTDEQLTVKAGAGDKEAFRELVERHKSYIFTLLLQMIGHREAAEDLAQDVFLKLYRSLGHYRAESKFTTWLYRIAANTATDYKRAKARHPLSRLLERLGRELKVRPAAHGEHDPARQAVAKEGQELMLRLLGELPDKYKLILFLYHYRQLAVQEIAEIAEIPVKTVETRLYRGKALLKQKWMEANPHETRPVME